MSEHKTLDFALEAISQCNIWGASFRLSFVMSGVLIIGSCIYHNFILGYCAYHEGLAYDTNLAGYHFLQEMLTISQGRLNLFLVLLPKRIAEIGIILLVFHVRSYIYKNMEVVVTWGMRPVRLTVVVGFLAETYLLLVCKRRWIHGRLDQSQDMNDSCVRRAFN